MTPYEIEVEANKIMARIQEPKQKRFSMKLSVALVVLLVGLFMPNVLQNIIPRDVAQHEFLITQVSANEYLLNLFGDEMTFYLYGLVENEKTSVVNEKVTYYEEGTKYIDITDQLEVNPITLDEYQFLEVTHAGKPVQYLYVLNYNENNRHIIELGNNFENFELEMQKTIDLVNTYPYEMITKSNGVCLSFESHKDAKNMTKQQQQAYEAFLELQGRGCVESVAPSFTIEMHFNGTEDAIGDIDTPPHYVLGGEEENYKTVLPVTFNEALGSPNVILHGVEKDANLQVRTYTYIFEESDHIAQGVKIEFNGINSEDYEIELYQKGVQLEEVEIKKEDNTWYVMPIFINELFSPQQLSQTWDITIENELFVRILHKETKEILFEFLDVSKY